MIQPRNFSRTWDRLAGYAIVEIWYNYLRRLIKELETIDKARRVAEAASQKQAGDIVLLDTRELCSFADYFIICTSESSRQSEALSDEIEKAVKTEGGRVLAREGDGESGWVLLDLGDVICHIFGPTEREFYQLEDLWGSAPVILRIQ